MHKNSDVLSRGQIKQGNASSAHQQRGIALIFALILLVVITLLGLGAMRGTTLMQKIMANFYDRETAFQSAEAGLRAGAAALTSGTTNIRNCAQGGVTCPSNPFTDSGAAANIIDVDSSIFSFLLAANQPQYIIENMGTWPDPSTNNSTQRRPRSSRNCWRW